MDFFPATELAFYPLSLSKAVERVARQELVHRQLHKLNSGVRDTFEKVGGLEQLTLSDLKDVNRVVLPSLHLLDENKGAGLKPPTILEILKGILNEFFGLDWLSREEQCQICDTFRLNFQTRYDCLNRWMAPNLSPSENKMLAIQILLRVQQIKNEILQSLYKKKKQMDKNGLFTRISNGSRLVSSFRISLNKRLIPSEIMEVAMTRIRQNMVQAVKIVNQDQLQEIMQELSQFKILKDPILYVRRPRKVIEIVKQVKVKEPLNVASKKVDKIEGENLVETAEWWMDDSPILEKFSSEDALLQAHSEWKERKRFMAQDVDSLPKPNYLNKDWPYLKNATLLNITRVDSSDRGQNPFDRIRLIKISESEVQLKLSLEYS